MYSRELSWKLVVGLALPVVLALVAILWFLQIEIHAVHERQTGQSLQLAARLLISELNRDEVRGPVADAEARRLLDRLAAQHIETVIVAGDSSIIADTRQAKTPAEMLLARPESRMAIATGSGESSATFGAGGERFRCIAMSLSPDRTGGLIWMATPVPTLADQPQSVGRIAAVVAIMGITTVLALAYVYTRRWSRLLHRITEAATSLSAGDLSVRADVVGAEELEVLARAINETRQRLATHTETIDRQRRTFEALLTQLREGVVVVGADRRVVLMNPAAVRLLNLSGPGPAAYVGLALERCIPLLELQRLLLATDEPSEQASMDVRDADRPSGIIALERSTYESRVQVETARGTLHLLAHVSEIILPGPGETVSGPVVGRLLVLTDITELSRNIQMKTDFVANASHELRTPLSTIRAAVETLHNLDWACDADTGRRFISVIDRQSNRLEALASDLLDLSKLETGVIRFRPRTLSIAELLGELHTHFAERLKAKRIHWETDTQECDRGSVVANPQLLRLVLDNLIDNALKFTEPEGLVQVRCVSSADAISFVVQDDGCGIAPEDQQRVFERFYQVERARTGGKAERGTGLGLSIVRHAIAAMEGQVRLESKPGEGTRVTVTIPQPASLAA